MKMPMKPQSVSDLLAAKGEEGTDEEELEEGDSEGKALTSAMYDAIVGRDRDAFHEACEAYVLHMIDEPPHEDESESESEPESEKPKGLAIILGKH